MRDDKLSRRRALQVLGAIPAMMAAGALLPACGKKTEPDSCTDVTGLSEPEKMGRTALQYTDRSPHADKRCELCNLFVASKEPSQCGSCQVVKGPIHPKGHCSAFVPKPGA